MRIRSRDRKGAVGQHAAGGVVSAIAHNYAERAPGELFLIVGSSGYLEVSVGQGSAAHAIGCETGAAAKLMIW
jgi:S-adenosylmethionine hydrolase